MEEMRILEKILTSNILNFEYYKINNSVIFYSLPIRNHWKLKYLADIFYTVEFCKRWNLSVKVVLPFIYETVDSK